MEVPVGEAVVPEVQREFWRNASGRVNRGISAAGSGSGATSRCQRPVLAVAGVWLLAAASEVLGAQRFERPPVVVPARDSATFRFVTAEATVPMIEVSRRPPGLGPQFEKGAVVVAVFPALDGKRTRHSVRVAPLAPATRYYFIVTIAGSQGAAIKETGEFRTSLRMD